MPEGVYGVDVSKDWLDVAAPDGAVRRVKMAVEALAGLAAEVAGAAGAAGAGGRMVFEASGAYDRPLRRALDLAGVVYAGVVYARVNPARARFFARGEGGPRTPLAKTDRVDARMLRRMGLAQDLAPTQAETEVVRHIRALHSRRRQLVALRKTERTRQHGIDDAAAAASAPALLGWLDAEITRFDAAIAHTIAADPDIKEKARRLATAPGAGAVTIAALIAECPELGTMTGREIAALTGLAPIANDSGKRHGPRRIAGGGKPLRDLLYMAALSAARKDPTLAAFKARLRARGKAPKQATLAVARKLITILNAMIKQGTDFQTVPQ